MAAQGRDGPHRGGRRPQGPVSAVPEGTFASQLVSLLIAFVALYLIVSRIALPRVGKTIDDRQAAIEGDLAAAQKLKDESDNALKAYESELAAARSRAQAIGAETREKLNAASEAERKKLEDALSVKLAEAEKTIAIDPRERDEQRPRHCRGGGCRDRAAADRRAARRQVRRPGR